MVSFYIRDKFKEVSSIMCSVQYSGMQRVAFTVSVDKIKTKDWGSGRMITGNGRHMNSRIQDKLDKIRRDVESFVEVYLESNKKYPTKENILKFINSDKSISEYFSYKEKLKINKGKETIEELFDRVIKRRIAGKELTRGRRFSYQSITLYNSTLKALKGFQEFKKKKYFYVEDFKQKYLIEEFEIYLTTELDMMLNTIANKMKTLKSFLQIAWSEGIIDYNPFKKHGIVIYTEETDSVVFTKEEMIALEQLDLESNQLHSKIRDQYLIYLWSGIRKGDLNNLLAVVHPHTDKYVFRCSKTSELSEVPAFETLVKVAEKYNYSFPEPVHDTIVLREIKEICKLIPSMNINVERNYTKGGIKKRDLNKKYQRIGIHTSRRSLATVLAEHGLPHEQIMKITGHKKLLTLQKYIKSGTDINLMLEIGKKIKNI
jgi:site-specific recombinase XerD